MALKFLSIIGTRPQYVKVLDNLPNHVVADTRQHYDDDMSDIFLRQLKIKPKYKMRATALGDIIDKSTEIIEKEKPDIVIVYGDTRSTLGGALAAKFCNKTLVHIEAGMRSKDLTQPEELNRIIVDRISDYKFCVNDYARYNLNNEANHDNVYVVGDSMWDALNNVLPMPRTKDYEKYNLLTIHRQQNIHKDKLKSVFEAIEESGERFIFPCHPRTRRALNKFKIKIPKNVELIKPQGYREMISLETNCKKILTDSGGVQREGYWFQKPVLILRWETEWIEIVEDGWGKLVGTDKRLILDGLKNFNPTIYTNKPKYIPPFGAKERIKSVLCEK